MCLTSYAFSIFSLFRWRWGHQCELERKLADAQNELIHIKKDQEQLIIETERKAKEQADQVVARLKTDLETSQRKLFWQARELEQANSACADYETTIAELEKFTEESNKRIQVQQRQIGTMVRLKVKGGILSFRRKKYPEFMQPFAPHPIILSRNYCAVVAKDGTAAKRAVRERSNAAGAQAE